jgi:hypothetical protein
MALAHKYTVNIDHQFGGSSRYWKIYHEGYSGAVTELTGTGMPGVLDYPGSDSEAFDPIFGSEGEVRIWNLSADQFIEFATAKSRDYLVQLVNDSDSVIEWQGWLLPREVEEPWNQAPYETTLIFNCGLGLLSGYDFLDTDGSYFTGRATMIRVISDILSQLYPTTVASGLRPDIVNSNSLFRNGASLALTTGVLDQALLNRNKYLNEDGTVWNSLDVLRDIMMILTSRIQMSQNGWNIIRIRDLAMFYDSYDIPTQTYDADGTYSGNGGFAVADYGKAMTGPQARSSMIGWIEGSQRVRYERAYQSIRIKQDYGYRSLLFMGKFNSENWEDFWITGGSPVREQSSDNENEYHINLGSASLTKYIQQNIEGLTWTAGDTIPRFILSFEAMVDYADSSSYTLLRFAVRITYDGAPPAVNYYLGGQIGGTPDDPYWQAISPSVDFYFTTDNGLPVSKQWYRFELAIPAIGSGIDGDLLVRIWSGHATGSGTINSWNIKNCALMPTYDLTPPDKNRVIEELVSMDNLDIMPQLELGLGDVQVDNNEGQLFANSLSSDDTGESPTDLWYVTRRSGASRLRLGPIQPLADYLKDGYAIQHGAIRKRLSGRMVLDNHRWIMLSIIEDSIHYLFTRLTIDLKRGECDVSMLEIPEATEMGPNLIEGWTNNDFDSFAATDDLITALTSTGSGKYADADDAISYNAYDRFRVTVDGTMTASGFRLAFGGYNLSISDGFTYDVIPSSAGSTTPRLSATVGTALSMTNVTITIKKIYGL